MNPSRARDHDSAALAARAEGERRAGRPERARELARAALEWQPEHPAAHVAYALALIDCGDLLSGHRALEQAFTALGGELAEATGSAERLDEPAPLPELADDELESAFESAEAQRDEMHDANHVAVAALERVEDGLPEGVDLTSLQSPFATETIAGLLERQGQRERADEVRSAARMRGQFREQRLDDVRRAQVVATLTRWLDNLRRRTA